LTGETDRQRERERERAEGPAVIRPLEIQAKYNGTKLLYDCMSRLISVCVCVCVCVTVSSKTLVSVRANG